jgi:NitT/TauT family transport system permease protein
MIQLVSHLAPPSSENVCCERALVSEVVGATQGLGYLIMVSPAHLETDTLFSAIFAAALAGITLFHLLGWAERRLIFWQRQEDGHPHDATS